MEDVPCSFRRLQLIRRYPYIPLLYLLGASQDLGFRVCIPLFLFIGSILLPYSKAWIDRGGKSSESAR
jgi:hypothetical protein